MLKGFEEWLAAPAPPALGWKRSALIALVPSGLLVFIVFLLEPSGTDRYQGPWRNLRLAGYFLCVLLPICASHLIERLTFARRKRTMLGFFGSRLLLVGAIVSCCYFYNILVINQLGFSWSGWVWFVWRFGLPYVVLLMPLLLLLELRFAGKMLAELPASESGSAVADAQLLLSGRNAGDQLRLRCDDFVYAEALQNYVQIVFRSGADLEKRLLRTTLTAVLSQVPCARRIHRSYLINPARLLRIEGARRKRRVWLEGVGEALPMSMDLPG